MAREGEIREESLGAPGAARRSFVCPTCRNPFKAELPIVDLNTNSLLFGGVVFHLAPQEAEFMAVLVDAYPDVVSTDKMMMRLYGGGEMPGGRLVEVYKTILRRRFEGTRLKIVNERSRGNRLAIVKLPRP